MTTKIEKQSFIVYTDAGTAPGNPGPTGVGIHGYVYKERDSKMYSGHSTHSPTVDGYVDKLSLSNAGTSYKDIEVDLVEYIDAGFPLRGKVTNQFGEVTGVRKGLEIAEELGVSSVTVISDSKYAVEGINSWIYGWMKKDWKRPDGTEYANRGAFEELYKVRKSLEAKDVKVTVRWTKGHIGEPGNEQADTYATISRIKAAQDNFEDVVQRSPARGYWKTAVEKHPFFHLNNVYIRNIDTALDGNIFFTGTHGKEEDDIGAKATESSFAIFHIDEPDPIFKEILDTVSGVKERRRVITDPFIRIRLPGLFNSRFNDTYRLFGPHAMEANKKLLLDHYAIINKEPIVVESNPPFLAYRLMDDLEDLYLRYEQYKKEDPMLKVTDITHHLYEAVTKGKKTETRLKPNYSVGVRRLTLPVSYRSTGSADNKEALITLLFGIGMPGRNEYKRLEDLNPKVEVITWPEGDSIFRYAVVVHVDGARGIWSNIYSNYRFINKNGDSPTTPFVEYEDGQQTTI